MIQRSVGGQHDDDGAVADLGVPTLKQHGVSETDVPAIVAKSRQANSMKANPVQLSPAELAVILTAAL